MRGRGRVTTRDLGVYLRTGRVCGIARGLGARRGRTHTVRALPR